MTMTAEKTKTNKEQQEQTILRFTTVGSVDDGKSTLIGRLLFDTESIFEDQLAAVERTTAKKGGQGVDLALVTDGLAAEREQGITIDVAYRYFNTPKRKFIIADTPGHEQYTRNMVTGASTADLTIILIDARKGVLDQSRRHAFISSLLGIPYFVVAVNKMDLVDFDQSKFEAIKAEFKDFCSRLENPPREIFFIPISALEGNNVAVHNPVKNGVESKDTPWYDGPTVLHLLETLETHKEELASLFRLPVQYVIRVDNDEHPDFRGFAGQIAGGSISVGDAVISLPSRKTSKVKTISTFEGGVETLSAPSSTTIVLEDEIDTSRGDMLTKVGEETQELKEFSADLCWMTEEPLQTRKKYNLKHTSNQVKAMVTEIEFKVNTNTLEQESVDKLDLNDIARVQLKTLKPILADKYQENRHSGSFILIDEVTNNTVAAGMIR